MLNSVIVNKIEFFLRDYFQRYPESEVRDVYKLLYQSFHGAEHAIVDANPVSEWLEREWSGLHEITVEEVNLLEPIYIEGVTPALYRLNLAWARSSGIGIEVILGEFIRTAEEFPRFFPDENTDLHELFIRVWQTLEGPVSDIINNGDFSGFRDFTSIVEEKGWPAAHHSEKYRKAYDPHYRLVMAPELFTGESSTRNGK